MNPSIPAHPAMPGRAGSATVRGWRLLRGVGEPSLFWLVWIGTAVMLSAAVLLTAFTSDRADMLAPSYMLAAFGLLYWWIFWAPRVVACGRLLAEAAVPRAGATVLAALGWALLLSVGLPALLLAAFGAPPLASLAVLLLLAMAGLLLGLLPGLFSWLLCMAAALSMSRLQAWLSPPAVVDNGPWMLLIALLLAALAIWRGRRLLQAWIAPDIGRWTPYALSQVQLSGRSAIDGIDSMQANWTQQMRALRSAGAALSLQRDDAVSRVRSVLGPPFAPMPWSERLRQALMIGGWMLTFPLLRAWQTGSFDGFFVTLLLFALPFGLLAAMLIFPASLRRRRGGQEFSELALLPGLGPNPRHNLLQAVLRPQLAAWLLVLLTVCALALASAAQGMLRALPSLLLVGLACMSLGIGSSLSLLGGRLPRGTLPLLLLPFLVLIAGAFILPLQAEDATLLAGFRDWFHASAWLLLACGLGLALRGLRRLFAPGTALTGE